MFQVQERIENMGLSTRGQGMPHASPCPSMDSELAADNISMDVEDDARSGPVAGGIIIDDDTPCVLHPTQPSSPL
jgi:hypothetical protein